LVRVHLENPLPHSLKTAKHVFFHGKYHMLWRVRESPRVWHLDSFGRILAPLSVWIWQNHAITMLWNRRNTSVTRMSHPCHTHVTPMSHPCHTHVTPMSHPCHTLVTHMSHICHIYVTLMTRLRNKICYLELFLDKSHRLQVVIGHRREKIKNHSVKWNHYGKEVQTFITNHQTNTHAHKHTRTSQQNQQPHTQSNKHTTNKHAQTNAIHQPRTRANTHKESNKHTNKYTNK
jgi:hypothetical protein